MEEKSRAVRSVESEETFNDYEFSPVPDEKKNTWKAQVFVWLGVGFCLTAFTLGGQIALGLGFWPTVAAVLVGGIILTVVGALVGAIGVRSGLSSTVSSRFTFGTYGAIIFGLINALCNFGWFGYQCTFFWQQHYQHVQAGGGYRGKSDGVHCHRRPTYDDNGHCGL